MAVICPDENDICTCCGVKGSAEYQKCLNSLAINHFPTPCAKPAYDQAIKKNLPGGGVVDCLQNPAQCLQDAILGPVEKWLPGAAEKVGLFLFALILIVVGVVVVTK